MNREQQERRRIVIPQLVALYLMLAGMFLVLTLTEEAAPQGSGWLKLAALVWLVVSLVGYWLLGVKREGEGEREKKKPFPGLVSQEEQEQIGREKNWQLQRIAFSLLLVLFLAWQTTLYLSESGLPVLLAYLVVVYLPYIIWEMFRWCRGILDRLLVFVSLGWAVGISVPFVLLFMTFPEILGFEPVALLWAALAFGPAAGVYESSKQKVLNGMAKEGKVKDLIHQLKREYYSGRKLVLEALGQAASRGHAGELVKQDGVKFLVNQLAWGGFEAKVEKALEEVCKAGEEEQVMDCLLRALDSSSAYVRYHAILFLGKMGDGSVVPELDRHRKDKSEVSFYSSELSETVKTTIAEAASEAIQSISEREEKAREGEAEIGEEDEGPDISEEEAFDMLEKAIRQPEQEDREKEEEEETVLEELILAERYGN